jgi:hypothetical protein
VPTAQADTVKAVREAAEQEPSKQVAAVVSELKSGQAALAKLGRVAEAQQQQIEALQVPPPKNVLFPAAYSPWALLHRRTD